ncbi:MAG: hypothetical protein ACE37H_03595 [Phycisphaeraceae bacterium]
MMNKIVDELLSRMNAALFVTHDANRGLVLRFKQKNGIEALESLGCGVLLQRHLYMSNGPAMPPEPVDEPVYDITKPEKNLELASTSTLVRVLYQQQQPFAMTLMERVPRRGERYFRYLTAWQGPPFVCEGMTALAVGRLAHLANHNFKLTTTELLELVQKNTNPENPCSSWCRGLTRVLEVQLCNSHA